MVSEILGQTGKQSGDATLSFYFLDIFGQWGELLKNRICS